jgi:hypothetical protein
LLFCRLPDNFVSLLGFPENFHFYVYVLNMKISEKKFFTFMIMIISSEMSSEEKKSEKMKHEKR